MQERGSPAPLCSERKNNSEGAFFANFTLQFDSPTVAFDGVLGDGQPQPRPALGARPGLVHAIKPLEDFYLMLRRNALAGVGDCWREVGESAMRTVRSLGEPGRGDARATLKWIGSLAAVCSLRFVEEAVHGFSGE